MAGHSQFKNIMHRKGAQDAKRSKLFSKLVKEITVAVKAGGPDVNGNAALRLAVQNARAQNLPKDRIDRAVNKAVSNDSEAFEEVRYEGYGVGGVAVIVEGLTDNRNRTVASVRTAFAKYGGNLAETGSVTFGFKRVGEILYSAGAVSAERAFEAALEAGATDVESDDNTHIITCAFEDLSTIAQALENTLGPAENARHAWKPGNFVPVEKDKAETLMKMLDALQDNDDVQNVFANYDIDTETLEALSL